MPRENAVSKRTTLLPLLCRRANTLIPFWATGALSQATVPGPLQILSPSEAGLYPVIVLIIPMHPVMSIDVRNRAFIQHFLQSIREVQTHTLFFQTILELF